MADTFNYSLVQNDQGTYAVRSSVKSYNLDHVTDKDIVSFYNTFSQFASFDTGLLPLNGTGVLAIRSAGPHTQIVTQHAPGLYYINWGAHEGDRSAKTYYVAQPYRIVIGDFEHGNLLGARMFYSPFPITSPSNVLYHVNLPNINCKGYRGNGVGWICLYHKDDWSSLPFNEKVSRFIERCSGVETYNDANMSETDGPRFYSSHGKPSYVYDPADWQKKSEEGFAWTLDDDLWIPVLVKDMDNQDKHYSEGEPLTLAMAMLGNYQAYYTDQSIPKMYNIVSRPDFNFTDSQIADFFKRSFASAPVSYSHQSKDNPYEFTVQNRQVNGSAVLQPNLFTSDEQDEEDDENIWMCSCCEDSFDSDDQYCTDAHGEPVCESCINESYVYIESADAYYYNEDSNLIYSNYDSEMYHTNFDSLAFCESCQDYVGQSGNSLTSKLLLSKKVITMPGEPTEYVCIQCAEGFAKDNDLSLTKCYVCSAPAIDSVGWTSVYPQFKALLPTSDSLELTSQHVTLCQHCSSMHFVCPCGLLKSSTDQFGSCTPTILPEDSTLTVDSCCAECLGNVTEVEGQMVAYYIPFNEEYSKVSIKENIHKVNSKSFGITQNSSSNDELF